MSSDSYTNIPTVSRLSPDGTLIELVYNREERTSALAVSRPDGSVTIESQVELSTDERLVPYSATNNLIVSGCVLLPSAVADFGDTETLVAELRAYFHRYVDLSPGFEAIAAYYVLLSWVFDAFGDLPYLRFRGDYGTGKTRALLTIGSVSYKPFFASGASTVSPIFHVLDTFKGTLVLDEADLRFSDATADLTKILNNGTTKGLPILRTMTNRHKELNPQAFQVFGPKLVAMRQDFADAALESRFLTEETGGRPLRSDIPIHLPAQLQRDALQLRNKLLAWRFKHFATVGPNPDRLIPGIEPRLNQSALSLLSIIEDGDVRAQIRDELVAHAARVSNERAASQDAAMLAALLDVLQRSPGPYLPVSQIAERFNARTEADLGSVMSHKWVGSFLRGRLRLSTKKSSGVYGVPIGERPRIEALAARFGVVVEERAA